MILARAWDEQKVGTLWLQLKETMWGHFVFRMFRRLDVGTRDRSVVCVCDEGSKQHVTTTYSFERVGGGNTIIFFVKF